MYFNYTRLRKINLLRLRYFIGELFLIVISILIAVKLTFTDSVLKRRQEVLNEINKLIHLIKVELE